MATMPRPATGTQPGSTHRTYRDPQGGTPVTCRLLDDDELMALASKADRIEIRQAEGGGWVPPVILERFIQALQALAWARGQTEPEADRLRREMRRQIVDSRARIRIRYARHVLAGASRRMVAGSMQQVLVLVLVRRFVESCEWQLAA